VGKSRLLRSERVGRGALDVPPGTLLRDTSASHVTGGAFGPPLRGRWVLPSHWLAAPERVGLAAQLRRRAFLLRSGARDRGVLLAVAWNALPLVLVVAAWGAPTAVADVVRLALVSTLASFVGLLWLPPPSRRAVHRADLAAVGEGVDASALGATLERLERDQDEEFGRPAAVETIFHPIPSVERRKAVLDGEVRLWWANLDAWHVARVALYASWAGVGLLGRAVHCNLGRPEAWVFLPSD